MNLISREQTSQKNSVESKSFRISLNKDGCGVANQKSRHEPDHVDHVCSLSGPNGVLT